MADPTNSVLASLAQLSPDSDKQEVIATIDAAVDNLLDQLNGVEDGTLPTPFLEQVQQTIVFLEACTGFPDPAFTDHARDRMIELQQALIAARSGGNQRQEAAPENGGDNPEPPADPAEETDDESEAMPAAPPVEMETRTFEEVFADSLCKFVTDRFALFHVTEPPKSQLDLHSGLLPFPLSLEFSTVLDSAIREHIVGPVLESRNMKILAGGMGPEDLNEAHFMEVFSLPKRENVVRTLWTTQWDIVRAALRGQQSAEAQAAKPAKRSRGRDSSKQSLIGRMFAKKEKPARRAPARSAPSPDNATGLAIWSMLTEQPKAEYDPPVLDEIGIFDALFDYKIGVINKRKVAVEQLLRQEVAEAEGREGSSRLYMARMIMELPPHCGELIALWAYYQHNELFSPEVLKAFLASQATSEEGRRAALPMFLRWVPDPIGRGENQPE